MRLLAKGFLWLVGTAAPMMIAACYGTVANYDRCGRVADRDSDKGVEGIMVVCQDGTTKQDLGTTDANGSFCYSGYMECDGLRFEDRAKDRPGGTYNAVEMPVSMVGDGATIRMSR
jgi:hypothetical protein